VETVKTMAVLVQREQGLLLFKSKLLFKMENGGFF